MKIYERQYYDYNQEKWFYGRFICVGQWADGHLAYSRIDANNEEIEDEDGVYYQIRSGGLLIMEHV